VRELCTNAEGYIADSQRGEAPVSQNKRCWKSIQCSRDVLLSKDETAMEARHHKQVDHLRTENMGLANLPLINGIVALAVKDWIYRICSTSLQPLILVQPKEDFVVLSKIDVDAAA